MIRQINSYKELLEEKARLKMQLVEQELLIKEDWRSIKEDLKPAMLVGATLRKVFTRKAGITAAQLGINMLTDGFVKRVLLRKAGWLIRLVIPLLIKNYASHVGEGGPDGLMQKVKNFFSKNGKKHHDQETGMDAV
ncbi:MAG TPA: hypothetical protein VM187_12460 [Niastella sp.]|nr:hypothetical protein [Niastella sp.]